MSVSLEEIKIVDGGFSTQLARYVGNIIDGDPLWSARFLKTDPESVIKAHLDYLEAGADIIITNSYQASIQGFVEHIGCDEKASYELIKDSVKLAVAARDAYLKSNTECSKIPLIAGSVGPYGASLHDGSEYTGSYIDKVTEELIIEWHRPRIAALIEEGVDLLAIETIPALGEAEYLLKLMKDHPQQKAWLSFQCKDSKHTARGEDFKEAIRKCWSIGKDQLVALGCNCVDPKHVSNLIKGLNDLEEKIPLIVYPNSGEEYSPDKGYDRKTRWFGNKKFIDFNVLVNEWIDLGVKYVGGCCRTDADDIASIKKAVDERKFWEMKSEEKSRTSLLV